MDTFARQEDEQASLETRSSEQDLGRLFDEAYYQSGCGDVPYTRTEPRWAHFFGTVADNVIRALRPQHVLDAGCAFGFLVEAFWDRGVRATGIDISPYAIANVRRDMQPYCKVASIAEGIDGTYDLITCIEVLEHMPADQADIAIRHLTSASDAILFSSTPFDLDEPTHFNVRPLVSWLEAFQVCGFAPDLEFDASFVASHAMLLRRAAQPFSGDVLRTYASLLRFRHDVVHLHARIATLQKQDAERTERALAAARDASSATERTAAAEQQAQELATRAATAEREFQAALARAEAAERSSDNTRQQVQEFAERAVKAEQDLAAALARATIAEEQSAGMSEQLQTLVDRMGTAERQLSALGVQLHTSVETALTATDETSAFIGTLGAMPNLAEINRRIETLEQTVTGSCVPLAELFPAERLYSIERMAYEAANPFQQPEVAALRAQLREFEGKMQHVDVNMHALETRLVNTEARAIEASHNSNAILNSRIWRALVRGSGVLVRIAGRSEPR